MYCNLSKNQALPMALRVSSQPNSLHTSKIQFLSQGVYPKPSLNPNCTIFAAPLCGSSQRAHNTIQFLKPTKNLLSFGKICVEFGLPKCEFRGIRSLSSLNSAAEDSGVVRGGNSLPWLDESKVRESSRPERPERVVKAKVGSKSSWEVSAEKFLQKSGSSSVQDEKRGSRPVDVAENWHKPRFERNDNVEENGDERRRSRRVDVEKNWQKPHIERNDNGDENGNGDNDVIDDSRWNKIRTRASRVVNARVGFEKPEVRRWNKQESWGKKTFKEATESSVPKMIGEGVYGVGPVLAALTAGRREFYTLYVQEGLELSKNNKKKKDKKGFEKVLKISEKIGLSIREISKHDLNMVSDNRPHQGLVLDSSPLEMVNIKELDPVSVEQDQGVLWVALDEVTDPQNLGAIIRSSYFFGASGVVLCRKNSAPLSGVVSKASAGSLELMEIRSCKNMMQFLTSSSENGWRVLGGSVASRAVPLREIAPGEPTILVLGSEGTGLRPLVERSCTQLVRIPGNIPMDISLTGVEDNVEADTENKLSAEEFQSFMAVESLNVSVAAGVLLHHLIGNNYSSDSQSNHQIDLDSDALD
ncbi:uncharacterized protein LOC110690935 [Chenopodium quinoa]|uniref:uncharacterized protein LOC110690935 n=1 Tax=Chenopodium quinoa TaxID=63459 RepID=UPI000B773D73|nr:uncharacterized protein LOC110690935 [Chenopodium quinoa]